jgi:hypothetical protein
MSGSAHDRFRERRSQQRQQDSQQEGETQHEARPPQAAPAHRVPAAAHKPQFASRAPLQGARTLQTTHATHTVSREADRESGATLAELAQRERKPLSAPSPSPRDVMSKALGGRKKYYLMAGGIAVLLVWMAPMIAGWTPLRNNVLSSILADLNGSITSSSASLGWFSPVTLHNVEIRDERGDVVVRIPKLKMSRSVRQLMSDSSNLGYVQLEGPQLLLAFDERGSNVQRVLAKYLDPRRPVTLDCPAVDLEVVDGSAIVEDRLGRGSRWQVDGLGAKLAMQKNWAGALSLQVAGKVAQQQRAGQFDAHLELTRQRLADGTIGTSGSTHLSTSQLPLALAQPVVRQLSPRTEVAGMLSGEGDFEWGAGGDTLIDAQFTGEGIVLRSPALPKDTLHLGRIQTPCRIVCQGDQLRIERLAASCDAGQATLNGTVVVDLRRGLTAGILDAMRRNNYAIKGRVDLAQLAKLMPETLAVRRGTEINSGVVDIELARSPQQGGSAWQGQLTSTGLQAINDGRRVSWDKPIQMEFSALETKQGLQIRSLSCNSDFITLRAKGQLTAPMIEAEYNLDKLAERLADFFDLKPWRLSGKGWTQLEWQLKNDGGFEVWCETQLDSFAMSGVQSPTQPWHNDKVQLQVHLATKANPQTQRMEQITQGLLKLAAGGDRLEAKLVKPVDLTASQVDAVLSSRFAGDTAAADRSPRRERDLRRDSLNDRFGAKADLEGSDDWRSPRSQPSNTSFKPGTIDGGFEGRRAPGLWSLLPAKGAMPLEVDVHGELSRWCARLEPFLAAPMTWRIQGDCQIQATVNVSQQLIDVQRGRATIRGFRAVNETWAIDEPTLSINLAGTFRPGSSQADIPLAQAFGEQNAVALELRNVGMTLPTDPSALPEIHGDVIFNVELEKMQSWYRGTNPAVKPAFLVAGQATGRARFSRNGQVTAMQYTSTVRDLFLRSTDATAGWRDPELTAVGDLRYDRWADLLKIQKFDVDSKTKAISCRSTGQVSEMKGRRQLDLRGDLSYQMQQLAVVMFPTTAKEIEIVSGRNAHPFFVKGPLGEPPANGNPFGQIQPGTPPVPLLAKLSAGTQFDWTGANIYGFRFSAGEMRAQLQNGQVYFEPLNLAVNDGRLTAEPTIDLVSTPPKVLLKAGTLLDRVRITPEMCKRGLRYAMPTLYGVTEAQGQFSVKIKGCEIPLDDARRGERAGELIVHNVEFAPGPLLQQIAQAVDAIRLASGQKEKAASQLRVARLKRESVVEYVMRDGRVYHRNLELDFDGLIVKTRGWVGLDQTISIEAKVTAPKIVGRLPIIGGAQQAEFTIPIAGTLDQPQLDRSKLGDALKGLVTPDLLRKPAEDLLRAPPAELGKKLEGRAKEVIKGLDDGINRLIPR